MIVAAGGTGGHVLPAVAVVEELRRRQLNMELLWIGGHNGVERELAESNHVPFVAIQTGKLRRYLSARTFTDAMRIPLGVVQASAHVRRFGPDLIFSTGGATSFPTVLAGRNRAPILTHEQTAQIGISNKMASRFADTFAVGFDTTAELARQMHRNVVVTGNPVRGSILKGSRENGLARFGFSDNLPVLYVTGGARGASPLNSRIESLLPELLAHTQILHQAGPASANDDVARLTAVRDALPDCLRKRYVVTEFVREEIADVYAMTTLVVARSGAGTVTELGRLGLPSVLIPLPGTWGDEQRKNANILGEIDAAVVIEQRDASPERLRTSIVELIDSPQTLRSMSEAARTRADPQAASNLVDELLKLAPRLE
jgi:UDP-N-acetylglucosamine--N-acetylmuramyl-(pentapeptide) pyrophosphoryl-undecaprenol N-acetylglucosamine transferase